MNVSARREVISRTIRLGIVRPDACNPIVGVAFATLLD
jgi:hypothetical protein